MVLSSGSSERLAAGTLLRGRYRILNELGAGGFGAVYRAEDIQLANRQVAIKEMAQSGLKPEELANATEAFQREAYLLAGLSHPNLPRIYDHFRQQVRAYLVMEFLAGQTLETLLAQAPEHRLPISDTLAVGVQLATVLEYLHTHQPPIIFRDLKPANIMLTPDGRAYLIDFGIARLFKPGQAKDTAIIGTPGYLAPEGYGKAQTTPRSDMYSLGATLHHLLSGTDPFERPFFFAPLPPPVPAPLAALIAQMVLMEEASRPASMAEVKARLLQLSAPPALAAPTTVLPPTGRQPAQWDGPRHSGEIVPAGVLIGVQPVAAPQRPRGPLKTPTRRAVAVGLGVLLMGGTIWTLLHRSVGPVSRGVQAIAPTTTGFPTTSLPTEMPETPAQPATPTPPPTPRPANAPILTTFRGHRGPILDIDWFQDSRRIASAGGDSTVQIWDAQSQQVYQTHAGNVNIMVLTHNDHLIAEGTGGDTIEIWDTTSGAVVNTYPRLARRGLLARILLSGGGVQALAWSPDGTRLASSGSDGAIHIWNPFHGTQLATYQHSARALAWSPDGRYLALGGYNGDVQAWDVSGNLNYILKSHTGGVGALAWSPDSTRLASGGDDVAVVVTDMQSGNVVAQYDGHSQSVSALSWSPDGRRIASASWDSTVQVWDAATGGNAFVFSGHGAGVYLGAAAWSPDGGRIASGGNDGVILVWQAP